MLTSNSEGNTDVAELKDGSALQKDSFSAKLISLINAFKKKKKFTKSSLKINLSDVNTDPTESQKESGNYKKAHVSIHGLEITIENPKGSYRKGTDKNGKKWKCKMYSHYGYFKKTEGKDGDHVDVFIGPNIKSEIVFIVNQNNSEGKFDEHKVMLGFNTLQEAEEGYLKNYSKGWKGLGSTIPMTIDQFKSWIQSEDTKKPAKQFTKSQIHTELEWQVYFEKGKIAQVGETRTWSDGTIHKKTGDGKWVEVSSSSKKPSAQNSSQRPSSQAASQPKTHEQRAVETIDRWKMLEQKAKEKNRERMARSNPQNKQTLWDVSNARPGDVIRIERASSGRINRGHIGEVLDKVDGHIKVALANGGIYLFPPNELAFAKGGNKSMDPNLKEFFKGVKAEIGEVREWSDGNKYRKEASGWKLVGEGNKSAHQLDSKSFSQKTGKSSEKHKEAIEKEMQKGTKIPVKILREYPDLQKKYPEYGKRVKAIDAISKAFKTGSKVGETLEDSVQSAKAGKLPDQALSKLIETVKAKSDRTKDPQSTRKQKAIAALNALKPISADDVPENTSEMPIELTPEEKKKIAKLTQNNNHTEALMVEAAKHPNKTYLQTLKKIKAESDKLGHLAKNLRETRSKIEQELRKKPVNGNDVLST